MGCVFMKNQASMLNILVIEDDAHIAELIAVHLRELPAQATIHDKGWLGLDAALTGKFDFVVLDLGLPGLNGMEICRQIRLKNLTLPILMLTARSEEADKISGLETGADDYLTKPFSPAELLARIRTILRRTKSATKLAEKNLERIQRGSLVLDLVKKSLSKGGLAIELTVKEFHLLQLFMQNPGRNFSRQEILDEVWGEQFEGLEHTVNSNINRLRAKIEDDFSNPQFILTAWGVGYKFNQDA
jgi:two-component system, OmpR family, alkaline phosphatase synthesis response regulator PhoP